MGKNLSALEGFGKASLIGIYAVISFYNVHQMQLEEWKSKPKELVYDSSFISPIKFHIIAVRTWRICLINFCQAGVRILRLINVFLTLISGNDFT